MKMIYKIKMRIAAVLATGLLAGCQGGGGDDGKPVIGVSMLSLQSEFIVKVKDAMEGAAGEQGVRLIVNDAQRAAVHQVQQVESFIPQGVDAIIRSEESRVGKECDRTCRIRGVRD